MAEFDPSLYSAPGEFNASLYKPPEDHSKDNSILRGLKQGLYGVKAQVGGIYQGIADVTGDKERSIAAQQMREQALADAQALALPTDSLTGIKGVGDALSYAGNKLGNFLPLIAGTAGAALVNPAAGVAVGAGLMSLEGGNTYAEATKEGLSNPIERGLLSAGANAALGALPISKLTGTLGKEVLRDTAAAALKEGAAGMISPVTKLALKEAGTQAALQGVVGASMPLINRAILSKPIDTPDAMMEAIESAVPMGIMGGGFGYLHGRGAGRQAITDAKEAIRIAEAKAQMEAAGGTPLPATERVNLAALSPEAKALEIAKADEIIARRAAVEDAKNIGERAADATEKLALLEAKKADTGALNAQDTLKLESYKEIIAESEKQRAAAAPAPVVEPVVAPNREVAAKAMLADAAAQVNAGSMQRGLETKILEALKYDDPEMVLSGLASLRKRFSVTSEASGANVIDSLVAKIKEQQNAVQKQEAGSVLQREQGQAGEAGGQRAGVEQVQQGAEVAAEGRGNAASQALEPQTPAQALTPGMRKMAQQEIELLSKESPLSPESAQKIEQLKSFIGEKANGTETVKTVESESAAPPVAGKVPEAVNLPGLSGIFDADPAKIAKAEARDVPAIQEAVATGDMGKVLRAMREGATPEQKALIVALHNLNPDVKMELSGNLVRAEGGEGYVTGRYSPESNTVVFNKGGLTTEGVLHELAHVATLEKHTQARTLLDAIANGERPEASLSRAERQQLKQLKDLQDIITAARERATKEGVEHYGLSSDMEFLAEARSNPEFQAFLKGAPGGLWERFVQYVKSVLGFQGKTTMLDKALSASEPFFGEKQATTGEALNSVIKMDGYNIVENPTRAQAENLVARSKEGELRGLRDPETGQLKIWDAYFAGHDNVIKDLSLDKKSERVIIGDVKSLPEGSFSGEPGYGGVVIGDKNGAVRTIAKDMTAQNLSMDSWAKAIAERATKQADAIRPEQPPLDKAAPDATAVKELSKQLAAEEVGAVREASMSDWDRAVAARKAGIEQARAAQRQEQVYFDNISKWDDSPRAAGETLDGIMSHIGKTQDAASAVMSGVVKPTWKMISNMLPWETVRYMEDRLSVFPELARVHEAVKGYRETQDLQAKVVQRAAQPFEQVVSRAQKMMRLTNDPAAEHALNLRMTEVGTGSSINGSDFTMNGKANKLLRPEMTDHEVAMADKYYRDFMGMPVEARSLLVDGANANRKALQTTSASVIASLLRSAKLPEEILFKDKYSSTLDLMDPTLSDPKMSPHTNKARYIDGESQALDTRLQALFLDAAALPEGSKLKEQITELGNIYAQRRDLPYYSAGRTGEYFVNVGFKNMDAGTWAKMQEALHGSGIVLGDFANQDHAFMRVETSDQAAGLRRKLAEAAGDKLVMADTANGKIMDVSRLSNVKGVSIALKSILDHVENMAADNPGLSEAQVKFVQNALRSKVLDLIPENTTRSAKAYREGIPGYSGNFVSTFAKRAQASAQETGHLYTSNRFSDVFKGMQEAVETLNRTGSEEGKAHATAVSEEILKRYNNLMQPVGNDMVGGVVNALNSASHTAYLGASVAFYLRTMSQPLHRGLPILGSRYGFVSSAAEIIKGQFDAVKVITASIKNAYSEGKGDLTGLQGMKEGAYGVMNADFDFGKMGFNKTETAFLQELHDRGVLKLGQAHQLAHAQMSGSQKIQDAIRMTSMTANYAEMTNRLAMGLAAFRLAEKTNGSKGFKANTDYAVSTIINSMDDFSPYNTARAISKNGAAGRITPLMMQFMNYSLQTTQQIARTVHDGFFSRADQLATPEGKQRALEAKKEFAGLLATTGVISGALGLPFMTAIAGAYNAFMKDVDDPKDIRQQSREWLAEKLGNQGGLIASHGIGGILGVDTSTFGLQSLLPGSEFLASRRIGKERLAEGSQQLLGPALNFGANMYLGMEKISNGYIAKGIEQMLPSGVKAPWKAVQLARNGYTDTKGNPLGITATPADVAIQAVGFRPMDKAEVDEASNYLKTNQMLLQHRRQVITDQIFKAMTQGDAADKAKAMDAMREFNKKNPLQPIRDLSGVFRAHAMELATARMSGTGVGVTSARKLPLLKQIQFANHGGMPE